MYSRYSGCSKFAVDLFLRVSLEVLQVDVEGWHVVVGAVSVLDGDVLQQLGEWLQQLREGQVVLHGHHLHFLVGQNSQGGTVVVLQPAVLYSTMYHHSATYVPRVRDDSSSSYLHPVLGGGSLLDSSRHDSGHSHPADRSWPRPWPRHQPLADHWPDLDHLPLWNRKITASVLESPRSELRGGVVHFMQIFCFL